MNQKNSHQSTQDMVTKAIRTGHKRTGESEHAEPIFTTSSFVFNNAAEGAARMKEGEAGNVYSRYTNPTVQTFEQRLATMEGAERAVATASGMAAILSLLMSSLKTGDHMVCSRDVFGSTIILLENFFVKMGIRITYVDVDNLEDWQSACKQDTRLLYLESPSNPLSRVADIQALAHLAKQQDDCLLVVDNCLCTPILQNPLKLGADLVIHSATKYIDGQGRLLGGVVCGSEALIEPIRAFVRSAGPCMSSFNAWVFLKGLETLPLRMQAHCSNAMQVATYLQEHLQVEQVFYAGLESHSGHPLAKRQQSGFGGVLSFRIKDDSGGHQRAWQFIDSTQMLSLTPNLGDAKTTIIHPATTTHGRIGDEARAASGITDNLIRLSVGLESVDDIIADLNRGFDSLTSVSKSME